MKLMQQLTLCAVLSGAAISTHAQTNMDRLVTSTFKKQQAIEKQIVEMWTANKRGEKLNVALATYVDQEIRLNAMTTKRRNSLLSAITKSGKAFNSPADMSKALVQEYYKRKGLVISDQAFLKGVYHIRPKKKQ